MQLAILQLTPSGNFMPSDGRAVPSGSWRIDDDSARRVIDQFSARRTKPVLDYEHQTLNAATNGQPAPAAGWLTALHWRPGRGLFATAELTDRAAASIGSGEYRYVSPVFRFETATGEVLTLEMAAITNHPAIDGMAPIELMPIAQAAASMELSAVELTICNRMGLDPAAFLANRGATPAELGKIDGRVATTEDQATPANSDSAELTDFEKNVIARLGVDPATYIAIKSPEVLAMSDMERRICASTGVDPRAFLALKNAGR